MLLGLPRSLSLVIKYSAPPGIKGLHPHGQVHVLLSGRKRSESPYCNCGISGDLAQRDQDANSGLQGIGESCSECLVEIQRPQSRGWRPARELGVVRVTGRPAQWSPRVAKNRLKRLRRMVWSPDRWGSEFMPTPRL